MPETLDLDLTAHDLQDLSGADAAVAFFARLGYNTDVRTAQTAGNLASRQRAPLGRSSGSSCSRARRTSYRFTFSRSPA